MFCFELINEIHLRLKTCGLLGRQSKGNKKYALLRPHRSGLILRKSFLQKSLLQLLRKEAVRP